MYAVWDLILCMSPIPCHRGADHLLRAGSAKHPAAFRQGAAGGEDVTGIAAPFSGILLPHYMVRECLAFTVDFVFGRFHTGAGFWKNFSKCYNNLLWSGRTNYHLVRLS